MYEVSLNTLEWKKIITEKGPHPRFGHSGIIFEDNLYVFGGW